MSDVEILSITPIGRSLISRLETESHTYIVDGFLAHNSVNEFRGQLNDQAGTFLPRQEADARFNSITEKIEGLTTRFSEFTNNINTRLADTSGQREGSKQQLTSIYALFGGLVTLLILIGIVAAYLK